MTMIVTWSNHNRPLQADQTIAWLAGSTGAEDGQHSALQVFSGATLLVEKLDIDGETATVTTDETGPLTFKLWSKRDGFDSWQINEWVWTQATPDAVSATTITAATWYPPAMPPEQPHGEALVADGIIPIVQVTNEAGTDFLYSD